jgi:hypothetical protein
MTVKLVYVEVLSLFYCYKSIIKCLAFVFPSIDYPLSIHTHILLH